MIKALLYHFTKLYATDFPLLKILLLERYYLESFYLDLCNLTPHSSLQFDCCHNFQKDWAVMIHDSFQNHSTITIKLMKHCWHYALSCYHDSIQNDCCNDFSLKCICHLLKSPDMVLVAMTVKWTSAALIHLFTETLIKFLIIHRPFEIQILSKSSKNSWSCFSCTVNFTIKFTQNKATHLTEFLQLMSV